MGNVVIVDFIDSRFLEPHLNDLMSIIIVIGQINVAVVPGLDSKNCLGRKNREISANKS